MKRILSAVFLIWMFVCMTACTRNQAIDLTESTSSVESVNAIPEKVELKVFYSQDNPAAADIVKSYQKDNKDVTLVATAFTDIAKMDKAVGSLSDEEEMPDVILFSKSTCVNTMNMAEMGDFLDLMPLLVQNPEYDESNYFPVMDCGQLNDKQYLIPLRFSCLYFLTSDEKMEENDLKLEEDYVTSDLMNEMSDAVLDCQADQSVMQILNSQTAGGLLYDNLRLSGVMQDGLNNISEETFREYASYTQMCYEQFINSQVLLKAYSRDFTSAFSRVMTFMSNTSLPVNMRYYDSLMRKGLDQNLNLIPYPNHDEPRSITADISLYAAVMQSTEHAQQAVDFVYYAMNMPSKDVAQDLPVSRQAVEQLLNDLCQIEGLVIDIGSARISVDRMSAELREECEVILNRIHSGSIRNYNHEMILEQTMAPFITGDSAFDECYSAFLNQVTLS